MKKFKNNLKWIIYLIKEFIFKIFLAINYFKNILKYFYIFYKNSINLSFIINILI